MISYPDDMQHSRQLYERAKKVMPGGNTRTTVYMSPFPVYLARGEGCRVWDVDGNAYYDCINNFTSLIHGHNHRGITAALVARAPLGTAFGAPTMHEIELAEILVDRLPAVERVRFTNSGTEAVMMAIKAARAYTGRPKIVKIEGSYHGSYDFAEVSLDSSPENWGDVPASNPYAVGTPEAVLADVLVVPFNNSEALRKVLAEHGQAVAAVLIDPMPNRSGLIPATKEYLDDLVSLAHAAGALVILDEVISFRLGYSGAQGVWNIRPDLTTLGKVIGGGLPVGAVGGRADVMAVFDPSHGKPALPHGGTFTANPMTMCAGLAAMQALDAQAYLQLDRAGNFLRDGINASFAAHGLKGVCVGRGSLFKMHFTDHLLSDYRSVYPGLEQKKKLTALHQGLLARGVFCATYGLFALSTPMSQNDIQNILRAVDETLGDIARAA